MKNKRFKKIYIEIINTCNLNCSFCPKTKRVARSMSLEEFESIVEQICEYTDLIALHVKGEPLLHPNLKEILKICEKYNIFVNITTNGTLLYENVRKLAESKALRQINISLHSFEKSNQNISQNEYLKKIFESVEILRKENNPYISYRLWNLKNIEESNENIEILNALEKEYRISNLIKEAKENTFIKLDEKIFLNQDIEFEWPDLKKDIISEKGTCQGLRSQIAILSNGDVVPCCLDQDADIKLGNIFKDNFSNIIESQMAKKTIEGFKNKKLIHELCKRCGYSNTKFLNK